MAAPKKGRGSSGGQGRPGRALALILIAMVALTGGMFLSGHTTPRLGIDLAGGTSITLKAKSQPGKPEAINETNMNTAVSIIERRVNGLGVSEAEVQTQGASNIIVNIPKGTNSAQAREQVGTTAQLYFRPVLTVAGGAPTPEGSASPSATGSGKPSATPSAKASDPETASDPKATPSDGATTQGRAVTGALKKDATPTPS
ncbi:protein translocase subunit SecD, partial [[Kitasatospora] papulosa]